MRFRAETANGDGCQGLRLRFFAVIVTSLSFVALFIGPSFSESAAEQQPPAPQQKTLSTEEVSSFRQKAAAGDAIAQFALGAAYARGEGVSQNDAQSALGYLKGAQQGLAKAQHELGSLYLSGQGVVADKAEALMWLGLEEASVAGTEKKERGAALRKLASTMTRKEVKEAQKGARQWVSESARRGSLTGGLDLSTLVALKGIDASAVSRDPSRRSDSVVPPRLREEVRPIYTKAAADRWIEGKVLLACVVESSGAVGECEVVRSLDASLGLDQQAVDAARKWRFEPSRRGSAAAPVMVKIEITFTMRGSPWK